MTSPTDQPTGGMQRGYDRHRQTWQDTSSELEHQFAEGAMAALDLALGFDLYCSPHRQNHRLGLRDVERLIYGLQGELSDARTEPADERQEADEAGWKVAAEMCPLESLSLADDSEGYAEHVESMIECRIAHAPGGPS